MEYIYCSINRFNMKDLLNLGCGVLKTRDFDKRVLYTGETIYIFVSFSQHVLCLWLYETMSSR
jgi:hypothetical protein